MTLPIFARLPNFARLPVFARLPNFARPDAPPAELTALAPAVQVWASPAESV